MTEDYCCRLDFKISTLGAGWGIKGTDNYCPDGREGPFTAVHFSDSSIRQSRSITYF